MGEMEDSDRDFPARAKAHRSPLILALACMSFSWKKGTDDRDIFNGIALSSSSSRPSKEKSQRKNRAFKLAGGKDSDLNAMESRLKRGEDRRN